MNTKEMHNPLGFAPVGKLMFKFAIPSIIGMLVSSLYNIVDQFFIGQAVGTLGNAATNIAFPLSMCCTSIALLFGIGGASIFNLTLGRGDKDKAIFYMGNALTGLVSLGTVLFVISELFLGGMMHFFGAPDDVLPYAMEYVRITAIGFPFLILTVGGGHLIRADGSPRMTMICNLSGAIINTFLDALFVMVFGWGMAGAALATILGQFFSAGLVINYMRKLHTAPLEKKHFIPQLHLLKDIALIGCASCFNQLAMMVVQITLNNSLKYYGALSVYGEAIPIACSGIVMKTNQVFFSVIIGLAQGTQPIESFNYGAKNYPRVRKAYFMAIATGMCFSMISFTLFQTIPEKILALFGQGSPEYFEFGAKFFRRFLFFTWLNSLQPITSTFFTSIGKSYKGMFLSMTRQILFLLPLIVILPRIMGIDGILNAGPAADIGAAIAAVSMAFFEMRNMNKLQRELK